ncbi:MAG: GNAT family N-acetyltransferase [Trueperaceae bacterium]|nr:GNAT family N-acetyltransferase [Trueperaceae bacterium]
MEIRELTILSDLQLCELVQREVWRVGDREILAASHLNATVHAGGLVAAAFEDDEVLGFVHGFPAYDAEQRGCGLHSHLMGVRPQARRLGVGKALKWYQRDWCLARGLTWVRWTFDPLQAKNARLNLEYLGAEASVYRENAYGYLGGDLNGYLPTDRLLAQWNLEAPHVVALSRGEARPEADTTGAVVVAERAEGDGLVCTDLTQNAPRLRLDIPPDLNGLLRDRSGDALKWRLELRQVFTHYFAQGYRAERFVDGSYLLVAP